MANKRANIKKALGNNPTENSFWKYSYLFIPLFICILGIIIYFNSLNCSFHYDDIHTFVNNDTIRDLDSVQSLLNLLKSSKIRFVGVLTLALNKQLNHNDVFGYHVVNLSIHLASSLLAWKLVLLLFSTPVLLNHTFSKQKRLFAVVCGFMFVSHPVQTQAVTYITQRFASLATMFYLASLCLYIRGRLSNRRGVAAIFFLCTVGTAFAGLFTKEIVFSLPLTILLLEHSFFRTKRFSFMITKKNILLFGIPFLVICFLIPGLFFIFGYDLSDIGRTTVSDRFSDPPLTSSLYFLTQFRVIITYVRLLFLPLNQSLEYDFPASLSFFELSTLFSFLILTAIILFAFFSYHRYRLVSFGIFWFFITLSIESSISPLHNVIFEHRLYLPVFGFILFFTALLFNLGLKKYPKLTTGFICFMICLYSFLSIQRNAVWKNDITLWSDVTKKFPVRTKAYLGLGDAFREQGRSGEAKKYYNHALTLHPGFVEAYLNLGVVHTNEGNFAEAKKLFYRALDLQPLYTEAYFNLGKIYDYEGDIDKAAENYLKAVRLKGDYVEAFVNLGDLYIKKNMFADARRQYDMVLYFDPDNYGACYGIGRLSLRDGNIEEAKKRLIQATGSRPGSVEPHNLLGRIFFMEGNLAKAEHQFSEVVRLLPENGKSYVNLANVLAEENKFGEAEKRYLQALRVNPEMPEAYYGLGMIFERNGLLDEAEKQYRQVLNIQPGDIETLKSIERINKLRLEK